MITLIGGDLYQWDTGRLVFVEPDNGYDVHEVHFTTKKMDFAYVVKTYVENGGTYCAVPNILLQQYQDLICYEVRENDAGEESISTTTFDIIKRNRPVDYVYTEPEKYTYKEIENRLKILEDSFEEVKTNVDYAIAMSEEITSIMVKSVNNTFPDENGNVTIDAGSGGSSSSNNVITF